MGVLLNKTYSCSQLYGNLKTGVQSILKRLSVEQGRGAIVVVKEIVILVLVNEMPIGNLKGQLVVFSWWI